MTGPAADPGQRAAIVLGVIAMMLGLVLVAWKLFEGEGLHGGGLLSAALGLLAIASATRGNRAS